MDIDDMAGLGEFEKTLAAEKAQREREEKEQERKRRRHHRHERGEEDKSRRPDAKEDSERVHRHRSHRHDDEDKDRHRHRSHRHDEEDRDGHRSKRSRHSRDDEEHRSREHRHRDHKEHRGSRHHSERHKESSGSRTSRDKEPPTDKDSTEPSLHRDSWMTAPSAIDVDYIHRREKEPTPPPKKEPERVLHHRELNRGLPSYAPDADDDSDDSPREISIDYKFGDEGSQWRMSKLRTVYDTAERDGRSVEDIALERYGSLQEFDIAREEKEEMDRRKLYGKGYTVKEGPTGDLYNERLAKEKKEKASRKEPEPGTGGLHAVGGQQTGVGIVVDEVRQAPAATMDQTALNRLRAQMMKAKLRRDPDAARLEAEYNQAAAVFVETGPKTVALGAMENRLLAGPRAEAKAVETKRGRERGNLEENDDMTIDEMLQEERRTKGQAGGEGMRLAERIAKDAKFDNDLDYMDENASKLAKRVHKSELNLKNLAVNEFQKVNRILDSCPLCYHEDTGRQPIAPVVSLGTRAYLTLPTEPEVSDGGAVIVPLAHHTNLLDCDDDEWEEIRNFMKSLTRMYHNQGRDVIFYENAAAPNRHPHAAMVAAPIPYEEGETIPAYFKEAFLTADEEWSQHRKIIDTGANAKNGMGRMAFRRSIAKEMPYFHVWFTLDGGLGHIVEDSNRWPKGDLFAREVIGGVLDVGPDVIKKQGRWRKGDGRVEGFKKRWRKFDWTRVLEE
ncbi:related to cell cycle control protein cwf19 [Cephalotrichum gorgonifer]|uniref:Related to cell cycle control protein cwf19 n=1 Tax=Cephalotrichum gorgonifer TaxID=2041049 RepID=A0AAE8SWQ4_9PEZI|nr:related to cell cycle control protein cwf19 [Cephalotrichum gorgonifer]